MSIQRHFILIDPLEKLVTKKDSTLLFAHTLKDQGKEVYLLFEEDFYILNSNAPHYRVYDFDSGLEDASFYLKKFVISGQKVTQLEAGDLIHMRLDPPFDSRYLRICWMLKTLKHFGVQVLNSPEGIILHNEKLLAYEDPSGSLETFVGSGAKNFLSFATQLRDKGLKFIILKPLDLFQGQGVEKISLEKLDQTLESFEKKVVEFKGAVVAQPYIKSVEEGEVRALYYKGIELGSILKVPPKGSFLANIAQGAQFQKVALNAIQKKRAEESCRLLSQFGVDWVAFDILGDFLSEVNITCPGLLVEVSKACEKNLALDIVRKL